MIRAPRNVVIGFSIALVAAFVVTLWLLVRLLDPSIEAIDLYSAFVANPETTKAKYQGKALTVRGVVRDTTITSYGAVIHLEHRRDSHAGRFPADKVWIPFNAESGEVKIPDDGTPIPKPEKQDMGFQFQFDNRGRVIVPWGDGSAIRVTATPDFRANGMIILTKAKLL